MNFTLNISKNDFSKRNYFLSSANNSQSYFWFPLDYYKTSNIDHFELNLILAMERYHPLYLDEKRLILLDKFDNWMLQMQFHQIAQMEPIY